MKRYVQTKEQCQANIDKNDNVCDYCGQKLEPIETVDNSGNSTYWAGCYHNSGTGNFTGGVKKEIFDLAVKMVLDGYIYYYHLAKDDYKTESEKAYWFQAQTSGVCGLILKLNWLKENKSKTSKKDFFDKW